VKAPKFQNKAPSNVMMPWLEKLHADFYPQPVEITVMPIGGMHLDDKTADHLSRSELVSLVGRCGDKLHRGPVAKYKFSPSSEELAEDFEYIMSCGSKILRLLETHKINLVSGVEYIICMLNYGPDGRVQVVYGGPKAS
jgi:hypothetical protein